MICSHRDVKLIVDIAKFIIIILVVLLLQQIMKLIIWSFLSTYQLCDGNENWGNPSKVRQKVFDRSCKDKNLWHFHFNQIIELELGWNEKCKVNFMWNLLIPFCFVGFMNTQNHGEMINRKIGFIIVLCSIYVILSSISWSCCWVDEL